MKKVLRKQGRPVQNLVSANPGIQVNLHVGIKFSHTKILLLTFWVV